ncbi:hypothetical protein LTR15_012949 [Elasticomyces elasticus]|nr:hypothetical protein LTR15_012949 [Elasticomyces elasticus]
MARTLTTAGRATLRVLPAQPTVGARECLAYVDPPPAPNFSDAFTVLAGPDREPTIVHRDTLCRDSEYFTAACSSTWQRQEEKIVTVEHVQPFAMRMYVYWKYTRRIDIRSRIAMPTLTDQDDESTHILRALLRLYVACDIFIDDNAKNGVMDCIIIAAGEWNDGCGFVQADHISYVWKNTTTESKLRKFVLDSCVCRAKQDDLSDRNQFPPEFFHELALRYCSTRHGGLAEEMMRRCMYHDHRDDAKSGTERSHAEQQGAGQPPRVSAKRAREEWDSDTHSEDLPDYFFAKVNKRSQQAFAAPKPLKAQR